MARPSIGAVDFGQGPCKGGCMRPPAARPQGQRSPAASPQGAVLTHGQSARSSACPWLARRGVTLAKAPHTGTALACPRGVARGQWRLP
ncbi:hypothetical protein GW17_00045843 [Ensete ventricosum]|nr:hypothetical protein GW17_00045843 [Ensete ventricosum]